MDVRFLEADGGYYDMRWPREKFPLGWVVEDEESDESEGSEEGNGHSGREDGGDGDSDSAGDDAGDDDNEDCSKFQFAPKNQGLSQEIPIPGRVSEKSKTNVPFRPGMTPSDFLYSILPEDTLTEWTAYSNEERAAHFLKQDALGVDHGYKVHGKPCPAILTREIKGMLAIFLIMGVAHVACLADAYRADDNLHNAGIVSIMPLFRFKQVRTSSTCSCTC